MVWTYLFNGRTPIIMPRIGMESSGKPEKGQTMVIWIEDIKEQKRSEV
jgi:hypothetical protein